MALYQDHLKNQSISTNRVSLGSRLDQGHEISPGPPCPILIGEPDQLEN